MLSLLANFRVSPLGKLPLPLKISLPFVHILIINDHLNFFLLHPCVLLSFLQFRSIINHIQSYFFSLLIILSS
jgi:hypothetical protein